MKCDFMEGQRVWRRVTFALIPVERIVSFIIGQTLNLLLFITLIIKAISTHYGTTGSLSTFLLYLISNIICYFVSANDSVQYIRWKIAQMQLFLIYFEIKWNIKLTRDQACENIRNSFALCQYFLRRYRNATIDEERDQMSKNSFILYIRFSNSFRVDKTSLSAQQRFIRNWGTILLHNAQLSA